MAAAVSLAPLPDECGVGERWSCERANRGERTDCEFATVQIEAIDELVESTVPDPVTSGANGTPQGGLRCVGV